MDTNSITIDRWYLIHKSSLEIKMFQFPIIIFASSTSFSSFSTFFFLCSCYFQFKALYLHSAVVTLFFVCPLFFHSIPPQFFFIYFFYPFLFNSYIYAEKRICTYFHMYLRMYILSCILIFNLCLIYTQFLGFMQLLPRYVKCCSYSRQCSGSLRQLQVDIWRREFRHVYQ